MEVETPVVESRFIPNFREPSTDAPGLVLTDDGTVYLVAADGSRTQIDGGGGGLPTGWSVDTTNVGDFFYDANGREIEFGPAGDPTDEDSGLHLEMVCIAETTVELFGGPSLAYLNLLSNNGSEITVRTDSGVFSSPDSGNPAFIAGGDFAALAAEGLRIIDLAAPIDDTDAVNKLYVDGRIGFFTGGIGGSAPWPTQSFVLAMPMDPVDFAWGNFQTAITVPATVIAASAAVMTYETFEVDRIDTRNDSYDIAVSISISNADATEVLLLAANASANSDTALDSVAILAAGLNPTAFAGSDLSYDTGTGVVTSAGGGTYAVVAAFVGNWD